MSDEMAVLLIILVIVLYWVYTKSKSSSGGYTSDQTLTPGTYRIGEDLSGGKGDMVAISGGGTITVKEKGGDDSVKTFKLHASNPSIPSRYRNLTLSSQDILEITGNMKVLITPAKSISDVEGAELTMGTYKFGSDVPPAKYNLKALSGDGKVTVREAGAKDPAFSQEMNTAGEDKASSYENILCSDGAVMTIGGTLKLQLTPSKKQRGRINKILDFLNQEP